MFRFGKVRCSAHFLTGATRRRSSCARCSASRQRRRFWNGSTGPRALIGPRARRRRRPTVGGTRSRLGRLLGSGLRDAASRSGRTSSAKPRMISFRHDLGKLARDDRRSRHVLRSLESDDRRSRHVLISLERDDRRSRHILTSLEYDERRSHLPSFTFRRRR